MKEKTIPGFLAFPAAVACVCAAITCSGCSFGDVDVFCIPCDSFSPACINKKLDCPVCSSVDDATGALTVQYDNGAYYIADGNSTVFYNSDGSVCYAITVDPSTGMITYTLNSQDYTELDGVWTCPDSSTWQEPVLCSGSMNSVLPGTDNYTSGATGCDLVDLPQCQTPAP